MIFLSPIFLGLGQGVPNLSLLYFSKGDLARERVRMLTEVIKKKRRTEK